MSTRGEILYHPGNRSEEQTWDGFSWPAFLVGPFWLLVKGLWGHAIFYIAIGLITFGLGPLIFCFVYGFMGNGLHKALLLKNGYLTKAQSAEAPGARPATASADDHIQRLKELADLRDRGVLSDQEFREQKAKVIV